VQSSFLWDGNRDYSPLLTIPTNLDLWDEVFDGGSRACRAYMHQLTSQARNLLLEDWGLSPRDLPAPGDFIDDMAMSLVS